MNKIVSSLLFLTLCSAQTNLAADEARIKINLSTKGNNIAFDVEAVQVPHGKDIVIDFHNQALSDSEILHNIALLKPGSTKEVMEFFANNDYDQEKVKNHPMVIAMTPMLAPGKKIQLIVPSKDVPKPGYYPYVCLVPGHGDMLGMKGILNVTKSSKSK
ncbi:plastocyanin/azurin family copper-binding protein [Pseudobacteriovorax antillogorgiicola]|uniref:Azurin n=1 Tax=Pseudobacteriovorax antillogorgiicola TaxID=1513793 RepID=A0A1Y6CGG3_9BACT|nr:plastocyanin/azurin family copper-binding protein [Pseudobacteriovorax antillogorgiicola]TCS47326.1 azurin [Pseudobacteriovorax antillogorgiicola]SMF62863.1 Azurin [Pseudobacteriovorax antillogorgiicola]